MSDDQQAGTWMLAAWPGLGGVAVNAAGYLIGQLDMEPVHEINGAAYFETAQIEVRNGIARTPPLPSSKVFEPTQRHGDRDILVFLGEAQPQHNGFALCEEIIDYARARNVERIVSIAALATQTPPTDTPDLHIAVTDPAIVDEIDVYDRLEEGQIGGLNGVILAAALQAGIPGMCLMAEIPYYAQAIPNLQASHAALRALLRLGGLEAELEPLREQGESIAHQMREQLQEHLQDQQEEGQTFGQDEDEPERTPADEGDADAGRPKLSKDAERRIESLFEDAQRDRAKATELKRELDRHGVFDQYEDRFLALFRRAE